MRLARLLVLIAATAFSTWSCAQRESVEIPKPSPATIRIRSVTPPVGSVITSQTIIVAELEYSVERFEPKRFKLAATAAETRPGYTWSLAATDGEESQVLAEAAGTRTVRFSAKLLWEKPDLKQPFEIRFTVNQLVGTWGVSVEAARTDAVMFNGR
jgi:hypothetical protein